MLQSRNAPDLKPTSKERFVLWYQVREARSLRIHLSCVTVYDFPLLKAAKYALNPPSVRARLPVYTKAKNLKREAGYF